MDEGLFWHLKSFAGEGVTNKFINIPEKSKGTFAFRTMSELFKSEAGGD